MMMRMMGLVAKNSGLPPAEVDLARGNREQGDVAASATGRRRGRWEVETDVPDLKPVDVHVIGILCVMKGKRIGLRGPFRASLAPGDGVHSLRTPVHRGLSGEDTRGRRPPMSQKMLRGAGRGPNL